MGEDAAMSARKPFATTASRAVQLAPDALLDLLTSPATWPQWQSEILGTSGPGKVSAGDVVVGRATMLGFHVIGRAQIEEVTPSSLRQDVIVGIPMSVRYEVDPQSTGSVVTHHLTCELPAGMAGRVLSFFLARRLRRMQARLLDQLAAMDHAAAPDSSHRPPA
jgi:polyketide cyclase/dehydrase/lipid transport protein